MSLRFFLELDGLAMRRSAKRMLLILAGVAVPLSAFGQRYPSKPIRVITPFSTGTAVDAVARVVGKRIGDALGQQVVIDNRVGAGGIIGTVAAAKSPAGIRLVHVAYKGAGPALNDLLGGQIPLMFAGVSNAVPHVASGRLRILAVSTAKRTTALPQVPTLAEAALPGFDYAAWAGYLAPAGTQAEIINKLHAEIIRAVGQPDVQEIFVRLGFEVTAGTPEEFARLIRSDMARVAKVVREAGIPVE